MASFDITYVINADDEDELNRILVQAEHFEGTVVSTDGLQVTLHAVGTQTF